MLSSFEIVTYSYLSLVAHLVGPFAEKRALVANAIVLLNVYVSHTSLPFGIVFGGSTISATPRSISTNPATRLLLIINVAFPVSQLSMTQVGTSTRGYVLREILCIIHGSQTLAKLFRVPSCDRRNDGKNSAENDEKVEFHYNYVVG